MSRLAYVFLFLAAPLMAQYSPVKKTPEVIKAEIETDVIRARLDLAASQRKLAALNQTLELRKLEAEAALRAARAGAERVLVAGSLYLAGEMLAGLRGEKDLFHGSAQ